MDVFATTTTAAEYRPETLRVERRVELGGDPGGVAYGEGAVWATNITDNVLLRIDPESGEVVARIRLGEATGVPAANGVAVGEGSVWASDPLGGRVLRIDPATNEVTATYRIPHPTDIRVGHGAAWVLDDDRIVRIDADTGKQTEPFAGWEPTRLAIGENSLWVFDQTPPDVEFRPGSPPPTNQLFGGRLLEVDPEDGEVLGRIRLETLSLSGLAVSADAVWYADRSRHSIARIDPEQHRVLGTLQLPLEATVNAATVVAGEDAIWFANAIGITRVDPETNAATGAAKISRFARYTPSDPRFRPVGDMAVADDAVFVADPTTDTLAIVKSS